MLFCRLTILSQRSGSNEESGILWLNENDKSDILDKGNKQTTEKIIYLYTNNFELAHAVTVARPLEFESKIFTPALTRPRSDLKNLSLSHLTQKMLP